MCGVVKSPALEQDLTSEHCGTIELNEAGVGFVILPSHFPDPSFSSRHKAGSTAGAYQTPLFQIVYGLTPIGSSMPHLHVLREVARLKNAADFNAIMKGPSAVTVSPSFDTKQTLQNGSIKRQSGVKTSSSSQNGSTTGHAGHALSAAPTTPGNDERVINNRSVSPEDWWNTVRLEEAATQGVGSTSTKVGGLPRSSSTGSLPTAASAGTAGIPKAHSHSDLTSSERIVHNDRLIDGPLPLLGPNGLVATYRRRFRASKDGASAGASKGQSMPSGPRNGDASQHSGGNLSADGTARGVRRQESSDSAEEPSSTEGRRKARPLCFFVAGGAPRGRVSWVVKTVPLSSNVFEAKAHNVNHDWRSIS